MARERGGSAPHRESDIDVLVVTRKDRNDEALIPTLWRVLDEMGNPRVLVDPRQRPAGSADS
jgi:predicted nucleotidyltransferase